jgi:tripartite-type tricarboxylate transporter receptor subunit TctC
VRFRAFSAKSKTHFVCGDTPRVATYVDCGDGIVVPVPVPVLQRNGKGAGADPLRGIGTAAMQRARALPNLQTISEQGLPGFEAYTRNMFFAPAKTPPSFVNKLNREINASAKDPAIRDKLDRLGVEVVENPTPENLKKFLPGEIAKWTKFLK